MTGGLVVLRSIGGATARLGGLSARLCHACLITGSRYGGVEYDFDLNIWQCMHVIAIFRRYALHTSVKLQSSDYQWRRSHRIIGGT